MADKLNLSYKKDSTGLFVWAKINNKKSSEEFTDNLLYDKNIFITPGTVFGTEGEGYVRFSLCVDSDTIKKAMSRL